MLTHVRVSVCLCARIRVCAYTYAHICADVRVHTGVCDHVVSSCASHKTPRVIKQVRHCSQSAFSHRHAMNEWVCEWFFPVYAEPSSPLLEVVSSHDASGGLKGLIWLVWTHLYSGHFPGLDILRQLATETNLRRNTLSPTLYLQPEACRS